MLLEHVTGGEMKPRKPIHICACILDMCLPLEKDVICFINEETYLNYFGKKWPWLNRLWHDPYEFTWE